MASWKELERHPLSAEYEDILGPAWDRFIANLHRVGILNERKITLYEGKVLDGWQLLRGCIQLNIEPDFQTLPEHADPQAFVITMQDHRRHESAERIAKRIADRRARVTDARVNGESLRTIAEKEEVSQETVRNDLKASTVKGLTVDPPNHVITGKDGKKRELQKQILCSRCARVGAVKNCPQCAAASKEKNAETDNLPKSVRNALADTWHAECARLLSKMRTECKGAFSWSSWLDAAVLDHLKAAEECFITAVPRKACPDCNGQKVIGKESCKTCRGGGYMASQV